MQFLECGLRHKVDSVCAWVLLSEVRLQSKQFDLAAEAAGQGIKCLHHRQSRGYQVLPELSAKLVLARGQSLLALGNATDAVPLFEALIGMRVYHRTWLCSAWICMYARASQSCA